MARELAMSGPAIHAAYGSKQAAYFAGARADMVARLPNDPSAAILEIGCGSGDTGRLALAAGKCRHYCGVELFAGVAAAAGEILSEVVTGDVEHVAFPWRPAQFDALILSEVLEHLIDPWATMRRLAPLVRPGGMVLASSPNVAHWRVIRELLAGRFELADQGVFDRTHMRWFTPRTYCAMLEGAGFAVEEIGPVTPFSARTRAISALTGGRLDHLFMVQINAVGRKRS